MYEISIQETLRRVRRIWLRLRVRYTSTQMTPVEVSEMSQAAELFWRNYYNSIRQEPLTFVGCQAMIIFVSGSRFSMPMTTNLNSVENYIRTAFQYIELMSQGIDVFRNGLVIRISGDELVDPQDVLAGRVDFKIGFDMRYPTRNILPSRNVNQNFVYEDQQDDDDDQQDDHDDQDDDDDEDRQNDIQRSRREELIRRIDILRDEIRLLDYNINQTEDLLNSLRISRNRWRANVQQLRSEITAEMTRLQRERSRMARQLRGLNRLLNSNVELSPTYNPTDLASPPSTFTNLQNSPFSVPDNFLDNHEDIDDLLDYINDQQRDRLTPFDVLNQPSTSRTTATSWPTFAGPPGRRIATPRRRTPTPQPSTSRPTTTSWPTRINSWTTSPSSSSTFHSPSSSDVSTDSYDTQEMEELLQLRRRDELIDEIAKAEYQINSLDDLIRDLRGQKGNKRTEAYRSLLRGFESQKKELRKLIQQWQRELRTLRRNI